LFTILVFIPEYALGLDADVHFAGAVKQGCGYVDALEVIRDVNDHGYVDVAVGFCMPFGVRAVKQDLFYREQLRRFETESAYFVLYILVLIHLNSSLEIWSNSPALAFVKSIESSEISSVYLDSM